MPALDDRARRALPSGLAGLASLAGLACAASCAVPLVLAAGVFSGVGWASVGAWMPGIAVALAALAGAVWWRTRRRRHRGGCSGDGSCACGTS
jgi:mercuric ion transport protein